MTISSEVNRVSYTGNGSTTAFATTFPFFDAADLKVLLVTIATGAEALQTLTTDYTVSGGDGSTGTVTMLTAPTSAYTLVIYRDPPLTQTTDLANGDGFDVETIEDRFDRLTLQVQRVNERINRAVVLPEGDTSGADNTLPVDRASSLLGFDASKNITTVVGSLPEGSYSSFIGTLLDDADAATALGTLGFTSTDATAAEGPSVPLYRNSASPAVSDLLGALLFDGKSDAATRRTFAKIIASILDPTNASEDAQLLLQTIVAGTLATRVTVGQGVQIGSPTDGDKGAGTLNATAVYVNGAPITGVIGQIVNTQTGAVATGTTAIPYDDTIPQNTEGDQYMSLAITPTDAASTLLIEVVLHMSSTATSNQQACAALFQDSTAGALATSLFHIQANGIPVRTSFIHKMTAGTTSETTFKVRAGVAGTGTTTFNGVSGGRIHGGVLASSITITEILP